MIEKEEPPSPSQNNGQKCSKSTDCLKNEDKLNKQSFTYKRYAGGKEEYELARERDRDLRLFRRICPETEEEANERKRRDIEARNENRKKWMKEDIEERKRKYQLPKELRIVREYPPKEKPPPPQQPHPLNNNNAPQQVQSNPNIESCGSCATEGSEPLFLKKEFDSEEMESPCEKGSLHEPLSPPQSPQSPQSPNEEMIKVEWEYWEEEGEDQSQSLFHQQHEERDEKREDEERIEEWKLRVSGGSGRSSQQREGEEAKDTSQQQPITFPSQREKKIERFKHETQRRRDYLIQFIIKKLGAEAAEKYKEVISKPPIRKAYFYKKIKESESSPPTTVIPNILTSEEEIKLKEKVAALTSEQFEKRKSETAAKARRKLKMDREEGRIFEILTSSSNPLEILEDQEALECCKYWINYNSTKIDQQVKDWRKELYPMLSATPPPNETEQEKGTRYEEYINKIRNCISLYGQTMEEYVKSQKDKIKKGATEAYKRKFVYVTEEEKMANLEKQNAYFRELYRRKKLREGISIKTLGSRREGSKKEESNESNLNPVHHSNNKKESMDASSSSQGGQVRRSSRIASRKSRKKPPPPQQEEEEKEGIASSRKKKKYCKYEESGCGSDISSVNKVGGERSGIPESSTMVILPQLREVKEELELLPEEEVEIDLALLPTTQHLLQEEETYLVPTKDPLS